MALLLGALTVFLAVVAAVAGLEVVQRLVPWSDRQNHNDVAGFIYAVLGVVYAVLLAFVTVAVWENFEEAKETVNLEASELAELYWLAEDIPDPEGRRIQELTLSYARVLLEEEWLSMQQGEASPQAWALVDEMRSNVEGKEPRTDAELVIYDKGLDRVHDMVEERRLRLAESVERIPRILWWVLVFGGVLVVGFTYLFGLENTRSHRLMIAALAAVISLALFTVHTLDQPFSGNTLVEPVAFEQVLDRLEQAERNR
jgi:hypothetical protein